MGAAAAQYRVGPSDFFTSGDLEADANTLKGQIEVLDNLDWTNVSQALFDSWNAFLSDWKRFYNETFVTAWFGAGWNNGNRDELIQFERRYLDFLERWKSESGDAFPGGVVSPSTGTKDTFGDHISKQLPNLDAASSSIATIVIVVIVGLLAWRYAQHA